MTHRLLVGLLLLTACGASQQRHTVPDARWQQVPAAERAPVDAKARADLALAQQQQEFARTQLDAAREQAAASALMPGEDLAPAGADAETLATWRAAHDARTAALADVNRARAAWLDANVAWYERRLDAATAQIDVVQCELQLSRAEAVVRHSDDFDDAAYNHQLSQSQAVWYQAEAAIDTARASLDAAAKELAAAKQAYGAAILADAPAETPQRRMPPMVRW